jgi:O-antigen ligase
MQTALLMLCVLIWLPICFYQIKHRGFLVLLIWLFIAPVAMNVIEQPGANPFFPTPRTQTKEPHEKWLPSGLRDAYLQGRSAIKLDELLSPTRLLVGILFSFLLLDKTLLRKYVAPLDRTEVWMGVFSLLLVLNSGLQSARFTYSLRIATDAYIVPFMSYFVTRRFITGEHRFHQLIRVLSGLGFYVIVSALIERVLFGGNLIHRVQGPFADRDVLYLAMMIIFFMLLVEAIHRGGLQERPQAGSHVVQKCVLYASPGVILLTLTRGNLLGFFVGVLVFLFLGRRLMKPSWKFMVAGLALTLVPLMILGSFWFIPEEVIEDRLVKSKTVESRLEVFQIAFQTGIEHPIFGIGLNNLRDVFGTLRVTREGARTLPVAHNSFITMLAEVGITGLLAYLTIPMSMVQMGLRLYRTGSTLEERWQGVGVIAMVVAYLVPAFTTETLSRPELSQIYVYVGLGAIAGRYSQRQPGPSLDISQRSGR